MDGELVKKVVPWQENWERVISWSGFFVRVLTIITLSLPSFPSPLGSQIILSQLTQPEEVRCVAHVWNRRDDGIGVWTSLLSSHD